MGAEINQKLKRKNQISAWEKYSGNQRAVNKKTVGRNAADPHQLMLPPFCHCEESPPHLAPAA